jgi:hypothetical protein
LKFYYINNENVKLLYSIPSLGNRNNIYITDNLIAESDYKSDYLFIVDTKIKRLIKKIKYRVNTNYIIQLARSSFVNSLSIFIRDTLAISMINYHNMHYTELI